MSLQEEMIAQIEVSEANDYQQRSALGMARSWVDGKELVLAANSHDLKPKRDGLAQDLVNLMEANVAEPEEYVEALKAVRKHVNAPYLQESAHSGADLRKPGEKKKAKE